MRMSESIKNIAVAVNAFQGNVKDPTKDGKANYGKYVQLDALLETIRPALTKQGLSFLQFPGGDGQVITITTLLMHTSGEWIESEPFGLKAQKVDPQGAGSAVTYGRRYSLSSVLGLAWDEDDDGNKASGKDKKTGNPLPEETKPIENEPAPKPKVIKVNGNTKLLTNAGYVNLKTIDKEKLQKMYASGFYKEANAEIEKVLGMLSKSDQEVLDNI